MPTSIEWCDETFNPWWGCEKVSPGCAHCYAEGVSNHRAGKGLWGAGHGFRFFGDRHWDEPHRWARTLPAKLGRRPRVFCASMADVFEERPELAAPRLRLFATIAVTPELDWLVLTKRPEFARDWLAWSRDSHIPDAIADLGYDERWPGEYDFALDPLPNVWMGVSIENARYTWRADVLREIPAAVRFISAEPLLGSLYPNLCGRELVDCSCYLDAGHAGKCGGSRVTAGGRAPLDLSGIDWVIIGGESGGKARPFHLEHAREIIRAARCPDCGGHGWVAERGPAPDLPNQIACERCYGGDSTALFVKQLGAKPVTSLHDGLDSYPLKLADRKGGDIDEWPADLRIREFPRSAAVLA